MRHEGMAERSPREGGLWLGLPDDVLVPVATRPLQFRDIWAGPGSVSPERGLALAVIQEALDDLTRYRFAKRRRFQNLYWEAYQWVADDNRTWPYSFVSLCDATGLGVDAIRQRVLDPMLPPRATIMPATNEHETPLGKAA